MRDTKMKRHPVKRPTFTVSHPALEGSGLRALGTAPPLNDAYMRSQEEWWTEPPMTDDAARTRAVEALALAAAIEALDEVARLVGLSEGE